MQGGVMRGKNYEERKTFLEGVVQEQGARFLLLKQSRVRGLDFALCYYGVAQKPQTQTKIARRFDVVTPFISQEVAVILCFLGMKQRWAKTTLDRVKILERRFFPKQDQQMSSRKRRLLERQTESERLRKQMGWSDVPLDLPLEEREFCLHLLDLYEQGALDNVDNHKLRKKWPTIKLVLILKYGLDTAGCYRNLNEVAAAVDLSIPAVDARLRKGLRYIKQKYPQSTNV